MSKSPTQFVWPPQDDEPEIHRITATADGVVDSNGAFVRTSWTWESTGVPGPDWIQARAKVAGVMHVEGVRVALLRRWIDTNRLGYSTIRIDGIRIVVPADYLIGLLKQIDWFNGGMIGDCPSRTTP